ncbi:MAG: Calx-beta domain-containing protein, partial [Verrucomicrobiota bacterium]
TLVDSAAGVTNRVSIPIEDDEKPILLDPRFHPDLERNVVIQAIAQGANDEVFVSLRNETGSSELVRLKGDGSRDTTFRAPNIEGPVFALAVQPDGQVLLAGGFTVTDGVKRQGIARLKSDGALDPVFDAGNLGLEPARLIYLSTLSLQPDGKVVVGGYLVGADGLTQLAIRRLNADGSPDASFAAPEFASPNALPIQVFFLLPNGQFLVGGAFTTIGGVERKGLVRLNADGSFDAGFDAGLSAGASVRSIDVQPDGRVLVAGRFATAHGVTRNGIARLHPDGGLDVSFDPKRDDQEPLLAVATLPDGQVLVGGRGMVFRVTPPAPTLYRFAAARLMPDGTADQAFAFNPNGALTHILPARNNTVVVAGEFDLVNDAPRARVARLALEGAKLLGVQLVEREVLAEESGGTVTFAVERLGDTSGPLTVNYATVDGTATAGADYVSQAGSLVFAPLENVKTIVVPILDDGVVDPGETLQVMLSSPSTNVLIGDRHPGTVRIHDNEAPATLDRTFDPSVLSGGDAPQSLLVQPGGKVLVGGYFNTINPPTPPGLVRLNADGSLDTTFSGALVDGQVRAIVQDAQGRFVISGYFNSVNQKPRNGLARLLADGSLDESFVPPPVVCCGARALTPLPDGRLMVLMECGPVYRLDTDGSLDASYQSDSGALGCAYAMAVLPDGKVLVGGDASGDNSLKAVVRLNPNGTHDLTFHQPVIGTPPDWCCPQVLAIISLPDGKILIGGQFTFVDGVRRGSVARLNADGTLDPAFVSDPGVRFSYPEGNSNVGRVLALDLQADGKVLVAGNFNDVNGTASASIVRLLLDGSLDPAFGPFEIVGGGYWFGSARIQSVAIQGDGNVLIAGYFSSVNGVSRPNLARLYGLSLISAFEFSEARVSAAESQTNATFTVRRIGDVSAAASVKFGTGTGTAADGADYQAQAGTLNFAPLENTKTFTIPLMDDAITEEDETVPLLLSEATGVSVVGLPTAHLRILDDEHAGSADSAFQNPFIAPNPYEAGSVNRHGLVLLPDGRILAIGWFYVKPEEGRSVIRLNPDGSFDPTFKATDVYGPVLAQRDGTIVMRGSGTLVRLLPDGSRDPNFRGPPNLNWDVREILELPDGRLVLAGTDCPGTCRPRLMRLYPDGSVDVTLAVPVMTDSTLATAVVTANGGLLIGGNSGNQRSPLRRGVARLAPEGWIDLSFNPPLPSASSSININALLEQDDGKVVAAGALSIARGTNTMGGVIRFNPDGSMDPTFVGGSGPSDQFGNLAEITTIGQQPDGKLLVAGPFSRFHGAPRRGLARLNPDGTLDPTLDIGEGFRLLNQFGTDYVNVEAMALQPNGQILVGGNFNLFNGVTRFALARLNGDGRPNFTDLKVVAGGGLRLTLASVPGWAYVIEASDDLRQWTAVSTNTASGETLVLEEPPAGSHRFFRAFRN